MKLTIVLAAVGLAIGLGFGLSLPARDVASPLEEIVRELEALPPPVADTGVIRGTLRDARGEPVAGRSIELLPLAVSVSALPDLDPDVTTFLRHAMADHARASRVGRAVSDSEGAFEFTGLPAGRFIPSMEETIERMQVEGREAGYVELGQHLALEIQGPCVRVPFDVPRAGGPVEIVSDRARVFDRWSPESPMIRLPEGRQRVTAIHDGVELVSTTLHVSSASAIEPVVLQPEVEGAPSTIARLAVRVVGPPELEDGEIVGFWCLRDPGELLDRQAFAAVAHRTRIGGSARASGEGVLAEVSPGSYWVGAGYGPDLVDAMTAVDIDGDSPDVALELPPVDPEAMLLITVVDENDEPAVEARVQVYYRWRSGPQDDPLIERVLRTGATCYIPSSPRVERALEEGLLRVHVQLDGFERRVVLESRSTTVKFEAPAVVTMALRGYPVPEPTVILRSLENPSAENWGWRDGGIAQWPARLAPGEYRLEVRGAGLVHDERVTLVPGDQTLRVTLARLVDLEIEWATEQEGAQLLDAKTGRCFAALTATGPSSVIRQIPVGDYVCATRAGVMEIRVDRDRRVRFEPEVPDALRYGDSVDPRSVGDLRQGDIILGAAGLRFEGLDDLGFLRSAIPGGFIVPLDVIRDGRPRVIRAPRAVLDVQNGFFTLDHWVVPIRLR